jgi:hypothetical protein
VRLDKGSDSAAYADVDLKGKLAFVRGDINDYYKWVVFERGAAGLITDYVLQDELVRGRYDQTDTMRYTSFWWDRGEQTTFGFVLTPREGDRLEKACREAALTGTYVQAKCYIDSDLYDGFIENVSALLPGETKKEILITAHLCHPRTSANDNASGVSAAVEALCVIKELVSSGKLPPLKRSIRILLVPEFTGTYAYLDSIKEGRKDILAGFNLDMVGGGQWGGYGPITLTDLPRTTPSFVGDLAAFIMEKAFGEAPAHGDTKKVSMFNWALCPFAGGSDHWVLSDPHVGIPTLMLGQWPDKYYHTSSDTVDRIDPGLLAKSCSVAACYAYTLATLELDSVPFIFTAILSRLATDLCELMVNAREGAIKETDFAGKAYRRTQASLGAIDDFARFFEGDEKAQAKQLAAAAQVLSVASALTGLNCNDHPVSPLSDDEKNKYSYVPKRVHFTPVQLRRGVGQLSAEQNKLYDEFNKDWMPKLGSSSNTIIFYIDGKSTAAEIMEALHYDFKDVEPEAVDRYLKLLCGLGFATIE